MIIHSAKETRQQKEQRGWGLETSKFENGGGGGEREGRENRGKASYKNGGGVVRTSLTTMFSLFHFLETANTPEK